MKFPMVKYNPAFLSRDELVRSFVVRHVDLDLIIETIKENHTDSNQNILVIGPRGMGKTMLALRAAAYIINDKELNLSWYPLVFSEESYEIMTAAEFWLRAIFHLSKQTGDKNLTAHHDLLKEERDEKRLYERALACLMDFADEQKKRLLLVVENLNMLFDEQIGADESWNIRHTLLNEPRIMLLATAPSRFDEIDNSGRAMFDLFKIQYLDPLDTMESKILWESLTGHKVDEKRIRPLQILTGGNPRLLTILSSFAAGTSFRELMGHLTYLIDEYTTYFKSNIESLPALERKIFITLANIWEPAAAAQVARDARLAVNKVSSLLKRLESRGSVCVVKSKGRKKSYQVVERLYNIYHLMRISGSQSDRVRAVVDFMVNFYEGKELAKKMARLTEEACCLKPEERQDHLAAYKEIVLHFDREEERKQIIQSTVPDFFKLPDIPESLIEVIDRSYVIEDQIGGMPEDSGQEDLSKTPNDSESWLKHGFAMQIKSQKYEEAEKAYRKAIEINPNYSLAWILIGVLFHIDLNRYNEAEEAYRKAIELDPKYDWTWVQLGRLLHKKLERYEEAEKAYRKAIEINPKCYQAWGSLGMLLFDKLKRFEEAKGAFRKATEINPKDKIAHARLGQLLHEKFGKYKEAEEAYRKAIEIDPKYAWAWAQLGRLLHEKLERYEEAGVVYRKAIEINPKHAWAWARQGQLFHEKLERYEEAEKAYWKAVEISPEDRWVWGQLVKLQIERLDKLEKIKDTISQCLKMSNRSAQSLNSMAWAIFETGFEAGFDLAGQMAQEALKKEPGSIYYQHAYASILGARGKWQEALSVASGFLKDCEAGKEFPHDIISFFTDAAAAGYAKESLQMLKESACAPYIEPLIVALQMKTGEDYNAPQEVVEVAKDVLKQIEEKKQKH